MKIATRYKAGKISKENEFKISEYLEYFASH